MQSIDEFLISLGLDPSGLLRGITQVRTEITGFAGDAAQQLASAGESGASAGQTASTAFRKGAADVRRLGDAAEDAAEKAKGALRGLGPVIDALRSPIAAVTGAFLGAAASAQAFSNYVDKADSLGKLARDLGLSVREVDAFGKAAEAAGGSAESLFASMRSFYEKTGRPAQEVFQLASKVEGMSRAAAYRYLQAQGVATDAIPVFLNGQKALDGLIDKYRQTAFTAQDAKTARAFKVAWMDFKVAAQAVGNVLMRAVTPVLTKLLDALAGMVRFIDENRRAFGILAAGLAVVFGAKSLAALKAFLTAVKALGAAALRAAAPFLAVAAAVAALGLAIDDIAGFASGSESLFGNLLEEAGFTAEEIDGLRESFRSLGDALASAWEAVRPFLAGALETVLKAAAVVLAGIVGTLESAVVWVIRLWKNMKAAGAELAEWGNKAAELFDAACERIGQFGKDIAGAFSAIPDAIGEALASAWDSVVEWFHGWAGLIRESVAKPLKDLFRGAASFFGFGDDETEGAAAQVQAGAAPIAARRAEYRTSSATVNSQASINVTNSFNGASDPKEVARQVSRTIESGAGRYRSLIEQAASGVNLKGAY